MIKFCIGSKSEALYNQETSLIHGCPKTLHNFFLRTWHRYHRSISGVSYKNVFGDLYKLNDLGNLGKWM